PHAAASRMMPPVLHVTFLELTSGGSKNLFASDFGLRINQCANVLQLISKSVSATRLIKRRPSPYPAREHLIEQPAIQNDIHRGIGRLYLHGSEKPTPVCYDFFEGLLRGRGLLVLLYDCASLFNVLAFAERENNFAFFAGSQFDHRLNSRARIKSGAGLSREPYSSKSRRFLMRTVAANKFLP